MTWFEVAFCLLAVPLCAWLHLDTERQKREAARRRREESEWAWRAYYDAIDDRRKG